MSSTFLTSRIALGTVQFGLDYGIANKAGRVPPRAVKEILDYAQAAGIKCLDTAAGYGQSESVLGDYLKGHPKVFRIFSKLPPLESYKPGDVKGFFQVSISRLRVDTIDGYLIHNFQNFLKHEALWEEMVELKKNKRVESIGFSLYSPAELDMIFEKNLPCDTVQVPYSVFDRRFENWFPRLKQRNIEIFVRSIFLQGLAFLPLEAVPLKLEKAKGPLGALRRISQANALGINNICLNFVLLNPHVDKVVIGIDNLHQLEADMEDLRTFDQVTGIRNQLDDVIIDDENILLPYRW